MPDQRAFRGRTTMITGTITGVRIPRAHRHADAASDPAHRQERRNFAKEAEECVVGRRRRDYGVVQPAFMEMVLVATPAWMISAEPTPAQVLPVTVLSLELSVMDIAEP